ncbi:MAG: DEAD/DEAH box helicase [Planctomycetes bacterium]|nr:DEAD/DEAH box helicase [Planctomycetota bacterium]
MELSNFSALGLNPTLLDTLEELGYETPTPIQEQCIPLLLQGSSLLGQAQTGTGKTAAFALPLLNRLDVSNKKVQVIVMTPTRELANQVAEAMRTYAAKINGAKVLAVYGGQDIRDQLRDLKKKVQIVVGTPGRVLDHLKRKSLDISQVDTVVLDEADEMLRMGFIDDVETILEETPTNAQIALFSATMPPPIKRVADKYLCGAPEIVIKTRTTTVETIDQKYLMIRRRDKKDAISRILEKNDHEGMLIFVRTKSDTVELAEHLEGLGHSVAPLNGDLSQNLREYTVSRLKQGLLKIVVATDVAARGLDVDGITHVVNYDVPYDTESYVHRIGRTGRAGRKGVSVVFATPREQNMLNLIEKATRQKLSQLEMPTNAEIKNQRVQRFFEEIEHIMKNDDLEDYGELLSDICLKKGWDIMHVAAALTYKAQKSSPLFPKLSHIETLERGNRGAKKQGPALEDVVPLARYRIQIGKKHKIRPGDIVGAIANETGMDGRYIGDIRLFQDYSTVDLPREMPSDLLQDIAEVEVRNVPLKLELTTEKVTSKSSSRPSRGRRDRDRDNRSRPSNRKGKPSAGPRKGSVKGAIPGKMKSRRR